MTRRAHRGDTTTMNLSAERRVRLLERLVSAVPSVAPARGPRAFVAAVARESGCQYSALVRFDGRPDGVFFSREARGGVAGAQADDAIRPILRKVFRTGAPVVREPGAGSRAGKDLAAAGLGAIAVFPLRVRLRTIGALCLGSRGAFA